MIPEKEEYYRALKERHGEQLHNCFQNATVAVCGLGGLGSNIAVALARAGIGKLVLIDFDRVDISNLHRQQYKASQVGMYKTEAMLDNLKEISPYADIRTVLAEITQNNAEELLSEADIVCEAFDGAEAKAMLADTVLEKLPGKYLVSASGMAGIGSCNSVKTRRITDRFYLCGDGISAVGDGETLFAPRVMLCASHQAHTVLRILAKEFDT